MIAATSSGFGSGSILKGECFRACAAGARGAWCESLQSFYKIRSRLARVQYVVYIAHLGGYHRVVEPLLVVGDELLALLLRVLASEICRRKIMLTAARAPITAISPSAKIR
jgi:hypothetical protein